MQKKPVAAQRAALYSDNWWTPRPLVRGLANAYADGQFALDVAACARSTVAPCFYDSKRDGLTKDWHRDASGGVCWMNCPYSAKEAWLLKAIETARAGTTVVALLPASVDTAWFQDYVLQAAEVLLVRGRVPHHRGTLAGKPKPGKFGSVVAVFAPGSRILPTFGVINSDGTGLIRTGAGHLDAVAA